MHENELVLPSTGCWKLEGWKHRASRAAIRTVRVGLSGFEESLYGLQIDLDLGTFGKCRGVVQQSEKEGDDLVILWACGPNFDGERFKTSFDVGDGGELILALYYNDRTDVPSWFDEGLDQTVKDFMKELASASDGTKLANWKEPYSLVDVVGEDNFDERRWRTTTNRLNDPQAAACYPGKYFPLPYALLGFMLAKHIDPSTSLPTLITKDNEALYSLADKYTRELSRKTSPRGQLAYVDSFMSKLAGEYRSDAIQSDLDVWKGAYLKLQAMMLTLSEKFERCPWNFDMVDDPVLLDEVCVRILEGFTRIMTNIPPAGAREILDRDKDFNKRHIHAGHFMNHVKYGDFEDNADCNAAALKALLVFVDG